MKLLLLSTSIALAGCADQAQPDPAPQTLDWVNHDFNGKLVREFWLADGSHCVVATLNGVAITCNWRNK